MTRLRWGLIACGNIARAFAAGLQQTDSGDALAVASRSLEKADSFADDFDIPRRYGSYQALLDDPDIDAVYIATPHPQHPEWAIKAANAGKHILCEKPITVSHADAMSVIEAARGNHVFLMEAFMYRCHPQLETLRKLIEDDAIGEVRMIEASFGFNAGDNFSGRTLNRESGGGGILDVGGYPMSFARLVAGAITGAIFTNPNTINANGHIGEISLVDEWAAATLGFDDGVIATIATGVRLGLENRATVIGSAGRITLHAPWLGNGRQAGAVRLTIERPGKPEEQLQVGLDRSIYAREADEVARCIEAGLTESSCMSWADTLGNMQALDQWRHEIALSYPQESHQAYRHTLSKRPLQRADGHVMTYGAIPGVAQPVSRLVMGMDNQQSIAHATAMFDHFIESGGNCFDSAHIYGGGRQETLFGQWITNRGIRSQVVLIGKGGHSPNCFPEKIAEQLQVSLERLQTDHVDIYFMHRDNLEVPVGEFVDVLNELRDKGHIGTFGGSNWTIERFAEANRYADTNGRQGFSVLSNNFSLAQMVKPVWAGCIAASTPDYIEWLTDNQIPLFPWSSQARGFFVRERAQPQKLDDPELYNSWYSDDNFERQARCIELAEEKGVEPVSIALAYVLHQPFPIFPLIGPRQISETVSSLEGLSMSLTDDERAWLNLAD